MDTTKAGWRRLVPGAPTEQETAAAPARPEIAPIAPPPEPDVALIARGVEMNGRLVVTQSLRIEGEFRGDLQSANSIFVSESGTVEAPIRARTVEIHGAVVGNIVASREVVIHATGRLHGDVETPSFVVTRGSTFNGKTTMYRPERNVRSAAPSPDAPPPETRA